MSDFIDVLHRRTASQRYDESASISEDVLHSILDDSIQAPSSLNLQHWRFMVITDEDIKRRLASTTLPSNQARVLKAPVSVLILGDMQAHIGLSRILDECVEAATLTRATADEWLAFATKVFSEAPMLARDEAIRSCSLAAMSLMLSATNRGLRTCPVGFNASEVIRILALPKRYVPVMWITLGRTADGDHPRRPRRRISDILSVNTPPS